MNDIFKELEMVNEWIRETEYNLKEMMKYYHDIIPQEFEHQVDYMNIDSCLDHISYREYCAIIAENLKAIKKGIDNERKNYQKTLSVLKLWQKQLTNHILLLSKIKTNDFITILNLFGYSFPLTSDQHYLHLIQVEKGELRIDEDLFTFLPSEIIDFLIFYINELHCQPNISLEEAFNHFKEQKEKKKLS